MLSILTKSYMHAGMSQSTAKVSAVSRLAQMLQGQATIDGMSYAVTVTVSAVAVALILTLFMRGKRPVENK